MKQCSACKQLLPLDNYSLSGRSATNYKGEMKLRYASRCKSCASDYVYELYTGRCAISGLETPLVKGHLDVPSLDCINPSLGYTKGNVQWVSWRVNRAKGEQSLEDFKLMCKAVLEGATTIP